MAPQNPGIRSDCLSDLSARYRVVPVSRAHPEANLVPFRSIIRDWNVGGWPFVINFVGNIVAFVPMGLLPPFIFERRVKLWHVLVLSLGLSLVIEGGQLYSGQRTPDVDDLILNSLGGCLGYLLIRTRRA